MSQENSNQNSIQIEKELTYNAEETEQALISIFHNNKDLEIQIIRTRNDNIIIAFIDGLCDRNLVDRDIITHLKSDKYDGKFHYAIKSIYKEVKDFTEIVQNLLNGNVVVISQALKKAIFIDFKNFDMRSVESPDAEEVLRGPKEGFNENYRTTTSLIRRKVRTPDLIFEEYVLGKQTNTLTALVYIKGIVNKDVLKEIRKKINKINIDRVFDGGHIEQLIEENVFSPFSGIGVTQKPDIVAARILEGRVAIICDGTPHVLTIPDLFVDSIHTADDYYNRVIFSAFLRLLRVFGLFISVMLPGLAVAILTYDQEMIPSEFLTNIIASTINTPLPSGAEAFFLILMFELLRESGTRLPKMVGNAISIVGALIIGEAAVSAGIVSAPFVIIIALMAVCSFILPNILEFIVFYRLIFLFLGATMGLVGISCGIVLMLTQLSSTYSFGVPILSTFNKEDLKDSVIRFPLIKLKYRPESIAKDNVKRVNME